MARFITRLLLFLSPWALFIGLILLIDPFDVFPISRFIPESVKLRTSSQIDPVLWQLGHFKAESCRNSLFGDSRMYRLSVQSYCNVALPGAHLKEIIDAFWYVDSRTHLDDAVIGINFDIYNASRHRDRVEFVRALQRNPFYYFTNRMVLEAAAYNLYYTVSQGDPQIGTPRMSRDEFWQVQVGPTTGRFYRWYSYPEGYRTDLKKIVEHCRALGIGLRFIIFPGHTDLQQRVQDYGLQKEYELFKRDLSSMAQTIDFDYPNNFTKDRINFTDPYHVTEDAAKLIVQDVWGENPKIGRVLSR
jgi:hypothetical protein